MARRTDVLEVVCWCEAHVTRLPREDVLAGRTVSCGAPGCVPPVPKKSWNFSRSY